MEVLEMTFCDNTVYNLKNDREKKTILDNLKINFNIDFMQNNFIFSNKLNNMLTRNEYLVSCITQGNKYYLYLTKFQNENYTILIDSKLTNNHKYPKILIIQQNFKDYLYNNTLFTGELVKIKNNDWVFVINDLLIYDNKSVTLSIVKKLRILYNILENDYLYDKNIHLFIININKYFNIKNIKYIFDDYIKNLNYITHGLRFTPILTKLPTVDLYFKKHYQYNNTPVKQEVITKSPHYKNTQYTNTTKSPDYNTTKSNIIEYIFEIRKTQYPNIYGLYCIYDNELKKHSIARVDTLECADFITELLLNKECAIVKCIYCEKFTKWIPKAKSISNISNIKSISNISNIKL